MQTKPKMDRCDPIGTRRLQEVPSEEKINQIGVSGPCWTNSALRCRRRPIHIRRKPPELLTRLDPPPQGLPLLRPPVHAHVPEEGGALVELLSRRFESERYGLMATLLRPLVPKKGSMPISERKFRAKRSA